MTNKNFVAFEKALSVASNREVSGLIGQQLRAHYVLAQPIPDRLAELVKQLEHPIDLGNGMTVNASPTLKLLVSRTVGTLPPAAT